MKPFTPRPYQVTATKWVVDHPKCALFIEPGLGKTATTLFGIKRLLAKGEVKKVLVLAPLRVAKNGWPGEVQKWTQLSDLRVARIIGTAAERKAALRDPAPIHTMNYENIPWLLEQFSGRAWPYDMVVCDESTKLKNGSSKRFKGVAKHKAEVDGKIVNVPAKPGLRHVAAKVPRWVNLTGTPAPNGLIDLHAQAYLLDGGARLGKTITAFRDRWYGYTTTEYGREYYPMPYADREITAKLNDICLTMKAADYLDLGETIVNDIAVEIPAPALAQYKQLERAFFLEIEGNEIHAPSAGVLSQKLQQAAAGALYTDETGAWVPLHEAKLDALEDLLEEMAGQPLIVCYNFKSDLERLQGRFPQARLLDKKQSTIDEWARGRIPMLLLHPGSAGHGVDGLQVGGNNLCFFSLDWNLENYGQVIERIGQARQQSAGFTRPTIIHRLLAEMTIDSVIAKRLASKASVQDAILEYMKDKNGH
jgi:SNF2 family DNA or RNA helicase